jgi:hypothetical protein
MNNAITIESLATMLPCERPLDGILAFLASRSKRSVRELSSPATEIFSGISGIMDNLILSAIEKRTADEFNAAFEENFPKYFAMTLALSQLAHAVVPPDVVERLTRETICELEADFRDNAQGAFGSAVREQAIFTVWTLRKVSDVLTKICSVKLDDSKQEEDQEYCRKFNHYALCAHYSLDCLSMALRVGRPLYPEVMAEITDGLRCMVNAYAWARRGASLRHPEENLPVEFALGNAEDDDLLASSMQDMASMEEEESL